MPSSTLDHSGLEATREYTPPHRRLRSAIRLLVYIVLAAWVTIAGLGATMGWEEGAGVAVMVRQTAHRPFVYRQLAPFAIRTILALAPAERWQRLEHQIEASGTVVALERWTTVKYDWWRTDDLAEILLSAALNLLALVGFAYSLRALLMACCRAPDGFVECTVVVGLLLLPLLTDDGVYVYDYPQLLLFTLGCVLLCRDNLMAFYPLLVLAAVSKETSVLLVVIFVATRWRRMPTRRLLAHTLAQLSLFMAVTVFLRWHYQQNDGTAVHWHLLDHNLAWLLRPGTLVEAFVWLGVVGLILEGWATKPFFLRRATIIIWPLLGTTLLFGWIDELRDYNEAYPILLSLGAITVAKLTSSGVVARNAAY